MSAMPLFPLTRLVLAVSAVVQGVMALAGFIAPDLTRVFLSPSAESPTIAIYYVAGFYLAGAVGAVYAFRQNTWIAARTYLASAFALIGVFVIITVAGLLTPPGAQPISWIYVLLSALYLPVVAWVWRRESARAAASERYSMAGDSAAQNA
jgi:hypothetical protein